MVGVGGIVVNNQNQILTISEKHAIIPGSWKLPGGYVERGLFQKLRKTKFTMVNGLMFIMVYPIITDENLVDAVIREVQEETGIKTTFDSLVCVRHALGGPNRIAVSFGCSDLYFVCALKADTEAITKCEREILSCEWMDFDKYLEHPKVHEMNRLFLRTFIASRDADIQIKCKNHTHELLKRNYQIYSVQNDQKTTSSRL